MNRLDKMPIYIFLKQSGPGRRIISACILCAFLLTSGIGPMGFARAQDVFQLPQPGTQVSLSPAFAPALLVVDMSQQKDEEPNAAGITPVIIDIRPMTTTVPFFMGVTE